MKDIKESVLNAVNPLGGFGKFINLGDVVLIKPNFNTADPFPASTSLDFLKAVAELILGQNPKKVILGESSTMSLNTKEIMEKTGTLELAEKLGIEINIFDENKWIRKEIPKAKYLKKVSLPEILDQVNKLILLPCLKTHRYARFTMSLKLSVGFIKPEERIMLHSSHLEEKIAELNTLIKPDLIIMDARKCFITAGPEYGEIREPNLILASQDRVKIDIKGLKILKSYPAENLLDLDVEEFPQIKTAKELNL